jgi:protein-tyrosine phosphatase
VSLVFKTTAGIGRTGTVLAGVLIAEGATLESAVAHVCALRRGAIETPRQLEFLRALQ